MTPGHGLGPARPSRRGLLTGGLALGASLALPGCAYIRDDVPTAAPLPPSAKAEIDGDLVYFNWADYLAPKVVKGFQEEYGVKVVESNYDSMEGMYAKIAAGNQYDIVFPIAKWVVKLRREGKLRAIDHARLTNADQVFYSGSYFNDPWYDEGSQVSVPFTVYKTGIGWRTDKVKEDVAKLADPYEILWNSSHRGRVGVLDEYRETIGMVLLKNGISNLNTTRPKHLDLVRQDLLDLASATRPVIDVNAYEDLPTGKTWVSMAFSGDLVAAPEYLPEGVNPEVLGYWFPLDGRGTVGNDLMTILRSSRNPVLAHHFLNFLLDFDMAMLNLEWNGFQPPLVRIDPSVLVKQGYIPPNLTTAVVRQEYFETGFRAVELDPQVDKSWRDVWSQFKAKL